MLDGPGVGGYQRFYFAQEYVQRTRNNSAAEGRSYALAGGGGGRGGDWNGGHGVRSGEKPAVQIRPTRAECFGLIVIDHFPDIRNMVATKGRCKMRTIAVLVVLVGVD